MGKNSKKEEIIPEMFDLNTRIITTIDWKNNISELDKNYNYILKQRLMFESDVQEIANFMNEKLGEAILRIIKENKSVIF